MKGEKYISKSGRVRYNYYVKTGKPHTGRPKSLEVNYNRNKKACLERDNYLCQMCGSRKNLRAHHKDNGGHHVKGTKTNDELNNLTTLCHRCHIKLHYNVLGKDEDMLGRRKRGETLQSIADHYGVSRQRVFQVLSKIVHPNT